MRWTPGIALGLAVFFVVLVADQVSKAFIIDFMAQRGFQPLDVTSHVRLVMVWNRGISFGMLAQESGILRWGLSALAFAIATGLMVWVARQNDFWAILGGGLVAGGAVGNAVDRVIHGAVADFIDLHAGGWSWPAFNIADSAITVGVGVLVLNALLRPDRRRRMSP